MYRKRNSAASISVCTRRVFFEGEAITTVEVGPRTEHVAMACNDNCLDAGIEGEDIESLLELQGHLAGEGIVLAGAVERKEDNGGGRW